MLPDTTDVLVIGAGPTGLTAAVSLAVRGRGVIVADSQAEGQNTSRASVFYPRTLELLDPYGVAEQLAARGIHARRFTICDHGRILMTVPFDRLPIAYPYTLLVSQAITEAVLLQRLGQLGSQVYRPHTLTGSTRTSPASPPASPTAARCARYLVGADGMHSTVREQAGIGFAARISATSYSLADVHLSRGLPAGQVAVYFSPEGQLVSAPFPTGPTRSWPMWPKPRPRRSSASSRTWWTRGPQAEPVIVQDIVWDSRFRIHHGVADRFHTGRVALADDADGGGTPCTSPGDRTAGQRRSGSIGRSQTRLLGSSPGEPHEARSPDQQGAEMNDLLDSAVAAHGGLDRWNQVKSITAGASITGALWSIKDKGDALTDVRFVVDTTRERLTMDFAGQDKRSVFDPGRVVIQRRDGALIDARDDPEKSFDGHQLQTPWDDIHLAYFTGEALWTYLNTPFLYTWPGFTTEEITPIEAGGETWRRLKVTFPDHIKSHTRQQISCFGPDGLLRRHDFTIDILGGATGMLYATGYRDVDGIIIPATRRGYAWQGDYQLIPEPLLVAIDLGEITIR